MEQKIKTKENLLRRMAKRQGMFLVKSRRRDPMAYDFGMYGLRDSHTGNWLTFDGLTLSLDQVADWLIDDPGPVFCGAEATISASAGRKGPKPGTGPVVRQYSIKETIRFAKEYIALHS